MGFIVLVILEAVFLSILTLAVDRVFSGSALAVLVKILAVGLIQKAILWVGAVLSGWPSDGNGYTPLLPKTTVRISRN